MKVLLSLILELIPLTIAAISGWISAGLLWIFIQIQNTQLASIDDNLTLIKSVLQIFILVVTSGIVLRKYTKLKKGK
jgi:hypothetical protein